MYIYIYIQRNTRRFWHEHFVNFNYFLILVVIIRTKTSQIFQLKSRKILLGCSQSWEKWILASSCLSLYLYLFVRPSVDPHETTRLPLARYSWDFLLGVLLKSVDKICLIKIGQNTRHFTRRCRYLYDNTSPNSKGDTKRLK